jgi:hypothetical protein
MEPRGSSRVERRLAAMLTIPASLPLVQQYSASFGEDLEGRDLVRRDRNLSFARGCIGLAC